MKKILILGGTGFVGRILSEKLAQSDNDVTLFNRGKRNPDILPEHKRIIGDRETEDIRKISGRSWDVIIDFSGMRPGNLQRIVNMMKGKVNRYIFISTASVYPLETGIKLPIEEEQETLPCSKEQYDDPDINSTYGQKKAEMERILLGSDWLDSIIFRPALIFGRYDPSDRFYYWMYKAKKQDIILIPEHGKTKSTNTFSEDFANVIYSAIDIPFHNKIYNAVTHEAASIKDILDISSGLYKTSPQYINATVDFLRKHNVSEWGDMPMWLHDVELIMDNTKMLNDFPVKMHTFEHSVKMSADYYDTLNWQEPKYGLKPDREKELIKLLSNNE